MISPTYRGQAHGDREVDMAPENLSYLALGDSYTIGESVASTLRWPVLLGGALQGEGVGVQEPLILARTGWTTDELTAGIQEAGLTGTYDLVSLLHPSGVMYARWAEAGVPIVLEILGLNPS